MQKHLSAGGHPDDLTAKPKRAVFPRQVRTGSLHSALPFFPFSRLKNQVLSGLRQIICLLSPKMGNQIVHLCCRSPHGERGLKFGCAHINRCPRIVAPPTGSVGGAFPHSPCQFETGRVQNARAQVSRIPSASLSLFSLFYRKAPGFYVKSGSELMS